jgi:hypothetical protein
MAFDDKTRNRLQNFVSEARTLLTEEFTRQLQNDYGLDPTTGEISDIESLTFLDDTRRQTAHLLRDILDHYQASSPFSEIRELLERIVREQAFTVLNRVCALRMAEARDILIESISNGYNSKGFQLYARVAGTALGETGDAYRNYLFSIFDEFAIDLSVLFDRYSPMGRLFPRESVLLNILNKINKPEILPLWAEDETIGWIYQYFNSLEERRQMRAESQAPRNSRELAVRNQFFTPRYVVEFLTDNTLGRIWYEMTQGKTLLKDSCRYLVRRPDENFLTKNEEVPEPDKNTGNFNQEELIKHPVYIPFRKLKDPREIRMLDPACGSMHFGLYAFDLLEQIYDESWDMEEKHDIGAFERNGEFKPLRETYDNKESLIRDVPRLIIENNLHGVDIDPRAVQIAGLSLWLRAQRTWKELDVKIADRPQIRKSNIVCAEPMPGEKDLLREFTKNIKPRILGQLLEIIFEKMEFAGEAGSLLKIDEEIEEAVEKAREGFNKEILYRKQKSQSLFPELENPKQTSLFDFTDLPDKTSFWRTAENKILLSLQDYAESFQTEGTSIRRLFAEDAAKGFAFIDLCKKRFDIVLMNPPYGTGTETTKSLLSDNYPSSWIEVYICFCERAMDLCPNGLIGALTSRTWMYLQKFMKFRKRVINENLLSIIADLGGGILDAATVEIAAWTFHPTIQKAEGAIFFKLWKENSQDESLIEAINNIYAGNSGPISFIRLLKDFSDKSNCSITYDIIASQVSMVIAGEEIYKAKPGLGTRDDFRFARLRWEVPSLGLASGNWASAIYGSQETKFYADHNMLINWANNGQELRVFIAAKYGSASRSIINEDVYYKHGLTYQYTGKTFRVQVLPKNSIITMAGQGLYPIHSSWIFAILSLLNSSQATMALKKINPGRFFQASYVNSLKVNNNWLEDIAKLEKVGKTLFEAQREINSHNETSTFFCLGKLSDINQNWEEKTKSLQMAVDRGMIEIDKLSEKLFSLNQENYLVKHLNLKNDSLPDNHLDLGIILGIAFGRWDIRYTTAERQIPEFPDPFDPIPVCPPGMLQNPSGLPAETNDIKSTYPIKVEWTGILVSDEGDIKDIIFQLRKVIEVIWKDKADILEQEFCKSAGVTSLQNYVCKPTKFFAEHFKIYSMNRRQAPIYWPLSSASGSYTIWLYYHRLNSQTLYTCINDFVEPKLKQVSEETDKLRIKTNRSRKDELELEKWSALELELKDFSEELLRFAKFWRPNLNDGVIITAAPLWKLFHYKPWQKILKQTWEKMKKGQFDWARLAYSIWPHRVIRASHKNQSYAIAHNLEAELWEETKIGENRQGNSKYKWMPKKITESEMQQLIEQKINEL